MGTSALMTVRSEEHTSELQSLRHLVCRLLLEKKNSDDGSSNRVVHGKPPADDAAAWFVRGVRAAPAYGWHLRGDCVFRCFSNPGTAYPAPLSPPEPRYYV